MPRDMTNKYLHNAKNAKNDEFYTLLTDIEKEMRHYREHFKGKTVFCNCDDPYESNFFKYFALSFNAIGIKKLIATCYAGSPIANTQLSLFDDESEDNKTTKVPHQLIINELTDENNDTAENLEDIVISLTKNKNNTLTRLKGDGDFRSQECIELLKQSDIVVTNPPFSLFREFVSQLTEYGKKYLIIGTWNAITYKEIFKLFKENKVWLGINSNRNFSGFIVPKHYSLHGTEARIDEKGNRIVSSNNTCWFTNLDVKKRHEELTLYKRYSSKEYPKYDNYDAIEVSKVVEIPMDYDGAMGVPVTFLDKYNPNQFEILGLDRYIEGNTMPNKRMHIQGKEIYARILIRKK